jgi:hypothetical protein
MHAYCTTQMALVFGGLLGQDVTFEGLAAFNGTAWTNAKSLFRAALGLHFGHCDAPSFLSREVFVQSAQACRPRALSDWGALKN